MPSTNESAGQRSAARSPIPFPAPTKEPSFCPSNVGANAELSESPPPSYEQDAPSRAVEPSVRRRWPRFERFGSNERTFAAYPLTYVEVLFEHRILYEGRDLDTALSISAWTEGRYGRSPDVRTYRILGFPD